MDFNIEKSKSESDFDYKERLIIMKLDGQIDIEWAEIIDLLDLSCSVDHFRKVAKGIYESYLNHKEEICAKEVAQSPMQDKSTEIQKERWKLQSEKLEYSKWLRENARDELILEKITDSISCITPLEPPKICIPYEKNDTEFSLLFGDEHFGCEFKILGLHGEILNEYSPEIFEARMWKLLEQTITILRKENVSFVNVFSMGDFTDGMIRIGQLMKLRYGVVDSTVKYMEFISAWLNELSKYASIKFHMVNGNHSEIRMFNQPRSAFKDENMGKIVSSYIKVRMFENPNFEFIDNKTDLIFDTISGYNVLGVHGEMKDMGRAIRDISGTYNTRIDFLIAGHLHHSEFETVGVNQGVIRVPSIVGIDDYSISLNRTSCPGATIIGLTNGYGKTIEYNIKL